MTQFIAPAMLAAVSVFSLTGLAMAENPLTQNERHPVVAQLALRDQTVTVTSHPHGYLYSVADSSGVILSAALTEPEIAEQYPELFDRLQPAIADGDAQLMMLAPPMME